MRRNADRQHCGAEIGGQAMTNSAMLWKPSRERVARSNVTDFAARYATVSGGNPTDYPALWRWSNAEREAFWRAVWDYTGVIGEPGARTLIDSAKMPGAKWF